jgi:hypothetical protein
MSSFQLASTITSSKIRKIDLRLHELESKIHSSDTSAQNALTLANQVAADLMLVHQDLSRNSNVFPSPSLDWSSAVSSHSAVSTDVLPRDNLFSQLAAASPRYGPRVLFGEVSHVSFSLFSVTHISQVPS